MPAPSGPARSGSLEHSGGQDHRGGQQEREPGGVPVGQPLGQSGHHGHPGPADAREAAPGSARCRSALPAARQCGDPPVRPQVRLRPVIPAQGRRRRRPAPRVADPASRDRRRGPRSSRAAVRRRSRITPFAIRNAAAGIGRPSTVRNSVLQQQAGQPDRDGRQDDQPGQPLGPAWSPGGAGSTRRSRRRCAPSPARRTPAAPARSPRAGRR